MKEFINDKEYDTNSATFILERRDEELLRTIKGEYFIFHWARCPGEKDFIEPLTENEAKEYINNWLNWIKEIYKRP